MAAQGEVNNKPNKVGADSLASALPHATAATLTNNRAISSPVNNPGGARGEMGCRREPGSSAQRAAALASPRASPLAFPLAFSACWLEQKPSRGGDRGG